MEIYARDFTPESLLAVRDLLPKIGLELVDMLGADAAAAILNARPGCQICIPKHADRHPAGAIRWAELAEIVGEEGMRTLAARWGGDEIEIPTCNAARAELRDRAIRAEFDRLTSGEGMSGKRAVYEIGIKFAPISSRAIENILNRAI
jgi:hypothetical protein